MLKSGKQYWVDVPPIHLRLEAETLFTSMITIGISAGHHFNVVIFLSKRFGRNGIFEQF